MSDELKRNVLIQEVEEKLERLLKIDTDHLSEDDKVTVLKAALAIAANDNQENVKWQA